MSLKLLVRSLTAKRYDKFRLFYHNLYATNSDIVNNVPGISLFQIKQSLKQKHIVTIEGHACIIIECPICDSEKSKKSKIYINKTTGKESYSRMYNQINVFDRRYTNTFYHFIRKNFILYLRYKIKFFRIKLVYFRILYV